MGVASLNTLIETGCCPDALRHGDRPWSMSELTVMDLLGEGATSTVVRCGHASVAGDVAVKMYHRDRLSDAEYEKVMREIKQHGQLQHSCIVPLYAAFEDQDGIYLLQEFLPGKNVSKLLHGIGGFIVEEKAKSIAASLCAAINYMHDKGIMHRDVKVENLLLSKGGTAKLADFGVAYAIEDGIPSTCVGTLDYMAPEVVRCSQDAGSYGLPADVWAAGVAVYEMLIGGAPFEASSKEATYSKILTSQPFMPSHLHPQAQDFLKRALTKDASQRPTAQQLSKHPWLCN